MDDDAAREAFLDLLSGSAFEPLWLPVLSGSMAPTLIPGDQVLVIPATWKDCPVGDIVVFRNGLSLTAHRLTGRFYTPRGVTLMQQGDGMPIGGFISADRLVGRCAALRRNGQEWSLSERGINRSLAKKNVTRMIKNALRSLLNWIIRKKPITR